MFWLLTKSDIKTLFLQSFFFFPSPFIFVCDCRCWFMSSFTYKFDTTIRHSYPKNKISSLWFHKWMIHNYKNSVAIAIDSVTVHSMFVSSKKEKKTYLLFHTHSNPEWAYSSYYINCFPYELNEREMNTRKKREIRNEFSRDFLERRFERCVHASCYQLKFFWYLQWNKWLFCFRRVFNDFFSRDHIRHISSKMSILTWILSQLNSF